MGVGVDEAVEILTEKKIPFDTRRGLNRFYYTALVFETRAKANKAHKLLGLLGSVQSELDGTKKCSIVFYG